MLLELRPWHAPATLDLPHICWVCSQSSRATAGHILSVYAIIPCVVLDLRARHGHEFPARPRSSDRPDPVTTRAERARRNGARSRGPRTEAGKARSSRNALTHGLTAKVHLLQPGEDEPAFQGLATRLFAELAPTGEVDGFLVANLAAAMWRTGRAHQHESLACDGPGGPDERRLGLALRYHGSASRELFRSLRALQELRRRPLAAQPAVENQPMAAAAPDAIPAVARLAWGGACPPAPPPGCLLMRPVAGRAPADWRWSQHHAFPGAEPVPVDAAGVAYALVDGAWLPQPAPEPALPAIRPPGSPPPPPRAAEPPPGSRPRPPHTAHPPNSDPPSSGPPSPTRPRPGRTRPARHPTTLRRSARRATTCQWKTRRHPCPNRAATTIPSDETNPESQRQRRPNRATPLLRPTIRPGRSRPRATRALGT